MKKQTIREVQEKILYIMKYIDSLCRKNNIKYYIMGGTALGAVRHGGFIPWDDDLDIFMTPEQYYLFKKEFYKENNKEFVIQEWKTTKKYLEYAKVRLNGTTFIEDVYKDNPNMHHGIYVDIMLLHKVPKNYLIQKIVYFESKFVTLYALSKRNWKPKTNFQLLALKLLRILPCRFMAYYFYKHIYKYDVLKTNFNYCYWITPAKFLNGLFDESFFSETINIPFEDTYLLGSNRIKEYLKCRYGDYMKLPAEEDRCKAVHAVIFDINEDYRNYFK